MTTEEFIAEVKNSEFNYPEFDEEYAEFQTYQLLVRQTLKEFHRVCELNGIPYQLAYGTAIGALRDNGQIPWDYDADVFVPYCEKEHLIKALDKDLSKDYYYMSPEIDPKCRHYFIRVAPREYRSAALHLDVFYVIGAPDEDPLTFGKQIRRLISMRYIKRIDVRTELYESKKDQIDILLRRLRYCLVPMGKIDAEFDGLCRKYDFHRSHNQLVTDFYSDRQLFHSDMWNTEFIKTCGGEFRIASSADEILRDLYGEYRSLPPLEERIREFRRSCHRIRRINQK